MLRVKICGITRVEDGRAAAEAGADAIGLVFHAASPRVVTLETARAITSALPPWMARVGVFVNAERAEIRRIATAAGLTAVQLQGDETPAYIDGLGLSIPVIKAIAMTDGWQERLAQFAGRPLLLDHARAGARGGTGVAWNYDLLASGQRPAWFILAGGLRPDTVAQAVDRLKPDAVDVSTGVESEPGIKDPAKIVAFMRALAPCRGARGST